MSYYNTEFSAKVLTIDNDFITSNNTIETGTTHIFFDEKFDSPIDKLVFPSSVTTIEFNYEFTHPIENVVFPSSLDSLSIGGYFSHSINNINVANNLKILKIYTHEYDKVIDWDKFPNIEVIGIPNNFMFENIVYPKKLSGLFLGSSVSIEINDMKLPDTLEGIIYSTYSVAQIDLKNTIFPSHLKILHLPIDKIKFYNICEGQVETIGKYYWTNEMLANLPANLQELQVPFVSEQINNLPILLKKIYTFSSSTKYFSKIPFGCTILTMAGYF